MTFTGFPEPREEELPRIGLGGELHAAYEAAVDALAYYIERDAYHKCANDDPRWRERCKVAAARSALEKVRPSR